MNTKKSLVGTVAVLASFAVAGCAAQSTAFRQLSAADHESAARSTQDTALAEEHLDAAKQLRSEEQLACDGVPETERVNGPFSQPDRITSVEVLRDRVVFQKGFPQPVGVAVYLKAEPGVTEQWLGRVVECHRAHLAVVGRGVRASPLSVANAQVAVSATAIGFRVTVTSKDTDTARSVVDKGRELAEVTFGAPGGHAIGIASNQ